MVDVHVDGSSKLSNSGTAIDIYPFCRSLTLR